MLLASVGCRLRVETGVLIRQPGLQLRLRNRPAVQISLRLITPGGREVLALFGALDSFSDGPHAEGMRQADDGFD